METTERTIRTEAAYDAALTEAASLMDALAGTPKGRRLEALVTAIEAYEALHWTTA
ncbi:MAG: hypothetical protein JWM27_4058 [Gemmatimonadetes bacterium]|nr:hypothetical protein [Gemmatimonadota bacterium]